MRERLELVLGYDVFNGSPHQINSMIPLEMKRKGIVNSYFSVYQLVSVSVFQIDAVCSNSYVHSTG